MGLSCRSFAMPFLVAVQFHGGASATPETAPFGTSWPTTTDAEIYWMDTSIIEELRAD